MGDIYLCQCKQAIPLFLGIGGAITDASAEVFDKLSAATNVSS